MDEPDRAEPADPEGSTAASSRGRLELVFVIVLALAALATAWSSYQAALWGGVQSSSYTQASDLRTEAAQQRLTANQVRIADLTVFENHMDALIDGDEPVADFYRQRFGDELDVAYQAWIARDPLNDPDVPATPFEMPEYRLDADVEGERLEVRAHALFARGETANGHRDTYTLSTLLFAATLFFVAIAQRFEVPVARAVLVALAGAGLVAGVAIALGQPITTG